MEASGLADCNKGTSSLSKGWITSPPASGVTSLVSPPLRKQLLPSDKVWCTPLIFVLVFQKLQIPVRCGFVSSPKIFVCLGFFCCCLKDELHQELNRAGWNKSCWTSKSESYLLGCNCVLWTQNVEEASEVLVWNTWEYLSCSQTCSFILFSASITGLVTEISVVEQSLDMKLG